MKTNTEKLKQIFANSYVLGGSPCSGKSSIAEKLAARFDLQYYKVDDHDSQHMERIDPDRHPTMQAFAQMSWNEIWSRPVQDQVMEELAFYHERFEMILEDLAGLAETKTVLMEGAALLPELIHRQGVKQDRALYMIPTKAFQVQYYSQRPWIKHILSQCEDPKQAFENWMERDHKFVQEIIKQLRTYRYRWILVDGDKGVDKIYEDVKNLFGWVA